jgi:hypothetical protein
VVLQSPNEAGIDRQKETVDVSGDGDVQTVT